MAQLKGLGAASLGLEFHSAGTLFSAVHHIGKHMMAVCPVSGDGN